MKSEMATWPRVCRVECYAFFGKEGGVFVTRQYNLGESFLSDNSWPKGIEFRNLVKEITIKSME